MDYNYKIKILLFPNEYGLSLLLRIPRQMFVISFKRRPLLTFLVLCVFRLLMSIISIINSATFPSSQHKRERKGRIPPSNQRGNENPLTWRLRFDCESPHPCYLKPPTFPIPSCFSSKTQNLPLHHVSFFFFAGKQTWHTDGSSLWPTLKHFLYRRKKMPSARG